MIAINFLNLNFTLVLILLALFVRLFPRLSSIQQNIHSLYTDLPSIDRIKKLYETAKLNSEKYNVKSDLPKEKKRKFILEVKKLNLIINRKQILKNINFSFTFPGLICIVGSSTREINITFCILNMTDFDGDILIDNESISLSLKNGEKIGYLSQEIFLFNGSIIENIVMGKRQTTEPKINEALQFGQILNYITTI